MRTTTILAFLVYPLLPIAPTFAAEGILDAVAMANLPGEITNSIGVKLKLIPAGEFIMGSPGPEPLRTNDEGPQHQVRITVAPS